MKLNKKELMGIILYTVVLIFAFIYIKEIFSFIKYIVHIFAPFLVGICIAYVLNVLVNVIENKWLKKYLTDSKNKRVISLLLALSIVIGFFTLLLLLIIPNLQNTIAIFADNLPTYNASLKVLLEKYNINSNVINEIMEMLKGLGDSAASYIKDNSNQVIETTLGIATNVVNGVINVIIGIVFAIYFLAQKERIIKQTNKVMKAYLPKNIRKKIYSISTLSNKVFSNFVSGQCLEALIIGLLCFIGMVILRLPYASSISVLVGFTALIPVFGAFIGTALGAFLIFMINPLQAIIFVIYIIVLQQFEGNLIYPHVVGKSVGLPGIWVLVAVTIGASINGVLGMLLSVPIVSIIYSILANSVNEKLKTQAK